jgi:hypothetical protein
MRGKDHPVRILALLTAVGVVAALGFGTPSPALAAKIVVDPPPPPSTTATATPQFNYDHKVKKVERDRKPVIALMRVGDVVELADYLPFGRGISRTKTDSDGSKTQTIWKDGSEDDPIRMPIAIRQFLVRELVQSGEFVVLERQRIIELARELALAKTPATDPDTTPRPGRLIGVHFMVEGAFYAAGALPPNDPALDSVRREIAKRRLNINPAQACVMYLNVYKVETGEVKVVACGAALQPMEAVKKAVEDLADQLAEVTEPIRISRILGDKGLALLDIGSDSGARVGDQFTLGPAVDPKTKDPTSLVKAEVVKVEALSSIVKISGDVKSVQENQEAHRLAAPPATPERTSPAAPEKTAPAASPSGT